MPLIQTNPKHFLLFLPMHTKTEMLRPIDYHAFRSGLATDKRHFDFIDPLSHFGPLILNFEKLAVGRHFWFILDFPEEKHCAAGGDVEHLTPFTRQEFSSLDQWKLHEVTHPDDLQKVLAFSRFWIGLYDRFTSPEVSMSNLKMSLFFRMINAVGEYYWIMVQYPEAILDRKKKLVYGLVLVTDVSHIKNQGEPMMNILNQTNNICQQFFCLNADTCSRTEFSTYPLTHRERQVLQLLARGLGSKQIASMLAIAVKTVDNHRQNMLHKTGSKSSSELVGMAIRMGML
jgi:DNA-binding CsgD family transcriptional regulator